MFTRFMDMHSGGRSKEPYEYIYIEAPEAEATVIFYNRFGHNPNRVTCTCCGEDYSIDEQETLEQATAFERGCKWTADGYVEEEADAMFAYRSYIPLGEYLKREDILVIREADIEPEARTGSVPRQGYVWVGD